MRSCTILLTFFLLFGIVSKAEANDSYHIDEQEFEELFASSEQSSDLLGYDNTLNTLALQDQVRYKSPDIAFVLAWFFGSLGVHRFYLGTSVGTGLAYIFTLGGCGILATIDTVILLIELFEMENFENYVDNPSFFMWN